MVLVAAAVVDAIHVADVAPVDKKSLISGIPALHLEDYSVVITGKGYGDGRRSYEIGDRRPSLARHG